jgi:hypothetical protein
LSVINSASMNMFDVKPYLLFLYVKPYQINLLTDVILHAVAAQNNK